MARISAPMKLVVGLAAGLALVAVGCASKSSSASGPTTPAPTASPSAMVGGGSGQGSGSGVGVMAAATVKQGPGGQYVFSPSKITVTKGQTIAVKNVGSIPHTFTIQGKGIDVVNQAGQSQKVKIDLAPGTYTFICTFHVNLGMRGTLIVKG